MPKLLERLLNDKNLPDDFSFTLPGENSPIKLGDLRTDLRATWTDKTAYDQQAIKLVQMFRKNFEKFEAHVGADVKAAAPRLAQAAE